MVERSTMEPVDNSTVISDDRRRAHFGASHLKTIQTLLTEFKKIDLICLLDELLTQNLDIAYQSTGKTLHLDVALSLISIIAAKLGLQELASERLSCLLARPNEYVLSVAAFVNGLMKRIDKVATYNNLLGDFRRSSPSSTDFIRLQQCITCFLLPHGTEEALEIAEGISSDFSHAELDFVLLACGNKLNKDIPRDCHPDFSNSNSFGPCNEALVALGEERERLDRGRGRMMRAIRSASQSKDMLTIDRLSKLLLEHNKHGLAMVIANENLEIPTAQALLTKAQVQYNVYESTKSNNTPEKDYELLKDAESITTRLLADTYYPNVETSIFLLKLRQVIMIMFEYEPEVADTINEDSLAQDITTLHRKINSLNSDPTCIVSHIDLALLQTKLNPRRKFEIIEEALQCETIYHDNNVYGMTEMIIEAIESNRTDKYLVLDSMIAQKILDVKPSILTPSSRQILRQIFKVRRLSPFCVGMANAGFLNLNKLCFSILSLSKREIQALIDESK